MKRPPKSRNVLYLGAGALGSDEIWSAWKRESAWSHLKGEATGRDLGAGAKSLCSVGVGCAGNQEPGLAAGVG